MVLDGGPVPQNPGYRMVSPEAVFVVANDGIITGWTAEAEAVLGIPASEAIGRRCCKIMRDLMPDQEPICQCSAGPAGAMPVAAVGGGWLPPC